MMVNANYTWLKCKDCGHINKILPGQKFNSAQDFGNLFKCNCKVVATPKKKVVKNAT